MQKYFIAYGTNIKTDELAKSFPEAKIISYGYVKNYALEFVGFNGHAIAIAVKKRGEKLPVAIWDFPKEMRYTLSNFESFPYLYERKTVVAHVGKMRLRGEIYVTKQKLNYGKPSKDYLNKLKEAYAEAGFDPQLIEIALARQPDASTSPDEDK